MRIRNGERVRPIVPRRRRPSRGHFIECAARGPTNRPPRGRGGARGVPWQAGVGVVPELGWRGASLPIQRAPRGPRAPNSANCAYFEKRQLRLLCKSTGNSRNRAKPAKGRQPVARYPFPTFAPRVRARRCTAERGLRWSSFYTRVHFWSRLERAPANFRWCPPTRAAALLARALRGTLHLTPRTGSAHEFRRSGRCRLRHS
jgi:hypothetical protein